MSRAASAPGQNEAVASPGADVTRLARKTETGLINASHLAMRGTVATLAVDVWQGLSRLGEIHHGGPERQLARDWFLDGLGVVSSSKSFV